MARAGLRLPDVYTGARAHTHGRTFASIFPDVPRATDGWSSVNEFLATIHAGLSIPRLRGITGQPGMHAAMTGTVPSDGDFSVPTEFLAQWLDSSLENEVVRPRADVRALTSRSAQAVGLRRRRSLRRSMEVFQVGWGAEAKRNHRASRQTRLDHPEQLSL